MCKKIMFQKIISESFSFFLTMMMVSLYEKDKSILTNSIRRSELKTKISKNKLQNLLFELSPKFIKIFFVISLERNLK